MRNIVHIFCVAVVFTALPSHASLDTKSIDQLSACLLHQSNETITLQQKITAHKARLQEDLRTEEAGRNRYSIEHLSEKPIAAIQELTQLGALIESIGISNRYKQRQLMHFKKNLGLDEQLAHWQKFLSKLEQDEKRSDLYVGTLRSYGIDTGLTNCK